MLLRYLKIVLAIFVALFCLFYATQNLVNLKAGYGFVGLMTSMEGHVAYPNHFGPSVTAPVLVWTMFGLIVALELAAGFCALRGAWDLWKARTASPDTFNNAKTYALFACGLGVVIWFGIFSAFGGAYFQMWQTEAGEGPLIHASFFSIQMAVLFLLIRSPE